MNRRGFITVDYLFSFFLVAGFSLVIITFSATLSTVEVVQYMTFAAARNYFAGHVSEQKQKEAASRKFFALKDSPVLQNLFNGGWFALPDESFIADFNIPEKYPQFSGYESSQPNRNMFHGAAVVLQAKILDFQVPFFGSTRKTDRGEGEGQGFATTITSFLGREPSFDECNEFNEMRWQQIRKLSAPAGAPYSQAGGSAASYVVMNDNGC